MLFVVEQITGFHFQVNLVDIMSDKRTTMIQCHCTCKIVFVIGMIVKTFDLPGPSTNYQSCKAKDVKGAQIFVPIELTAMILTHVVKGGHLYLKSNEGAHPEQRVSCSCLQCHFTLHFSLMTCRRPRIRNIFL